MDPTTIYTRVWTEINSVELKVFSPVTEPESSRERYNTQIDRESLHGVEIGTVRLRSPVVRIVIRVCVIAESDLGWNSDLTKFQFMGRTFILRILDFWFSVHLLVSSYPSYPRIVNSEAIFYTRTNVNVWWDGQLTFIFQFTFTPNK